MFTDFWNSIKHLAISLNEKMQRVMDYFLNFDLRVFLDKAFGALLKFIAWPFKTIVKLLLKLSDIEFNLESIEIKFSRIMSAVQDLFYKIVTIIIELWMKIVKKFFEKIGLGALLKYIPFTFCTFLHLVAAPLFALGGIVTGLIPPEVRVT